MEPANIFESIDQLLELMDRKAELLLKLKKGLRVAELLGMRPGDIKGRLSTHVHSGEVSSRPWRGCIFTIKIDGRPVLSLPLVEVHKELWPTDMREAYERLSRHNKKGMRHELQQTDR